MEHCHAIPPSKTVKRSSKSCWAVFRGPFLDFRRSNVVLEACTRFERCGFLEILSYIWNRIPYCRIWWDSICLNIGGENFGIDSVLRWLVYCTSLSAEIRSPIVSQRIYRRYCFLFCTLELQWKGSCSKNIRVKGSKLSTYIFFRKVCCYVVETRGFAIFLASVSAPVTSCSVILSTILPTTVLLVL